MYAEDGYSRLNSDLMLEVILVTSCMVVCNAADAIVDGGDASEVAAELAQKFSAKMLRMIADRYQDLATLQKH